MQVLLQILLGLVTFICIAGGLNLLIKGTASFVPGNTAPSVKLDNLFRFLSGIYFGLGFLLLWVLLHIKEQHDLIYLIGLVVACSGFGRLYSKIKEGSGGKYLEFIMYFEIVLGFGIILAEYLR
ncbi:MAG: DUF4345 domain-containing protein [Bacteroidetes bacterium]|nr:DUF4345 domain-containing protein [Bacteroidota bacterium]MBS1756260.1 DUF4345 domain-containing protein [Bacteroidota bacterium]